MYCLAASKFLLHLHRGRAANNCAAPTGRRLRRQKQKPLRYPLAISMNYDLAGAAEQTAGES